jgi:hypothetical protein
MIVYNGSWGGASAKNLYYYNNIFLHLAENPVFDFGESYNNIFENNLFYGNRAANEPDDPVKITGDPMFVNPGTGSLEGYMITAGSPAIGSGKVIPGQPEKDFYGNPVPVNGPVDIGVHQVIEPVSVWRTSEESSRQGKGIIRLYPNPAHDSLTVYCEDLPARIKQWRVVDCTGMLAMWEDQIHSLPEAFTIDIQLVGSPLKAGLYFLGISFEDGQESLHPFVYYE